MRTTPAGGSERGMPRRNGRNAFTLVELLVVVAIIALLISLAFPQLGKATQRARALRCQAALRGIGQAMQMYVDDRNGYLPPVATWPGTPPSPNAPKHHWCQFLAKYVNVPLDPASRSTPTPTPLGWHPSEKLEQQWWGALPKNNIFWGCPSWPGRDSGWNIPPKGPVAVSSPGYGMNPYLRHPDWTSTGESTNVVKLVSVTYASSRALVADAEDWHVTGSANFNNGYFGFASWSRGSPRRHGDRANYLFCDLSARPVSFLRAHLAFYNPAEFKE